MECKKTKQMKLATFERTVPCYFLFSYSLPDDFFDNGMAPKPLKGILKKPQLAGDYESSEEEGEEDMSTDAAVPASTPAPVGSTNTGTVESTLPAGKQV